MLFLVFFNKYPNIGIQIKSKLMNNNKKNSVGT